MKTICSPERVPVNQPPQTAPVSGLEKDFEASVCPDSPYDGAAGAEDLGRQQRCRSLSGIVGLLSFRSVPVVFLRNTEMR